MSLSSLAIRACTYLALYGNTIAEDRIYESTLAPLDDLVKAEPRPFLTISVDEAAGENVRGMLSSVDALTLVIDMTIAGAVTLEGKDGETETVVDFPATTTGYEWSLDLLTHQILRALDAGNSWSDLWRRFVLEIKEVRRLRGGRGDGVKYAARQIVMMLHPVADPDARVLTMPAPVLMGETDAPWKDFLAALRAVPVAPAAGAIPAFAGYPTLANVLEAAIMTPAGLTGLALDAAWLGLARETAEILGLIPIVTVGPDDVETVENIGTLDVDLTGDRADAVLGPDGTPAP